MLLSSESLNIPFLNTSLESEAPILTGTIHGDLLLTRICILGPSVSCLSCLPRGTLQGGKTFERTPAYHVSAVALMERATTESYIHGLDSDYSL